MWTAKLGRDQQVGIGTGHGGLEYLACMYVGEAN